MSKVGQLPIKIPEGVSAELLGQNLVIKGPKGSLENKLPREIEIEIKDNTIYVAPKDKSIKARALHGTIRAIIANNVKGVVDGWEKKLELVGTGYRAELAGNTISLSIGFSHPVKIEAPQGIDFKIEKTQITVNGVDKELVGQVAANIRSIRPPEPYKGKGIRYVDEEVRRKPGKAAKAQGAVGG